jgi:hypothetical protein
MGEGVFCFYFTMALGLDFQLVVQRMLSAYSYSIFSLASISTTNHHTTFIRALLL